MEVWGAVIDTQKRRDVESVGPKRSAGRRVVADLDGIVDVERPHIFEIADRLCVAGERFELVQHVHDTLVERGTILSNGGRVVTVEDLALGPFGATVARGTVRVEDLLPWPRIGGLMLVQRPYRGEYPQRLHIKRFAGPLRDAVIVDSRIGNRGVRFSKT